VCEDQNLIRLVGLNFNAPPMVGESGMMAFARACALSLQNQAGTWSDEALRKCRSGNESWEAVEKAEKQ